MNLPLRTQLISCVKRLVVKLGSGVLTAEQGLNIPVIEGLAAEICQLKDRGIEVIVVSSGAIASGMRKMGLSTRPRSVSQQQAIAAIGQPSLMMAYEDAFERHGHKVAQILVTRDDLTHRRRYLNARNTILTLLSWNITPIVNENDTVVVDEIKFGDNDNLSAMVVNLAGADFLINLTDIEGLFDKDPRSHKDAQLIGVVKKVDRKIRALASEIPGFLGTGGMSSKIMAAQKAALAGVPTVIASGLKPKILTRIFNGEEEGTLFLPNSSALCSRKHWIAFTKAPRGQIIIDDGAEMAIVKHGKSLLPSGIVEVRGRFSVGDSVQLLNKEGKPIAAGLVNYGSPEVTRIMGAKSYEIESILGFKHDDEVIHRDNLVLAEEMEQGAEECHFEI